MSTLERTRFSMGTALSLLLCAAGVAAAILLAGALGG